MSNYTVPYCEDVEEEDDSSVEGIDAPRKYVAPDAPDVSKTERSNIRKSRERQPPLERSESSSASVSLADTDSNTTRSSKQGKGARISTSRDLDQERRDSDRRKRDKARRDEREGKRAEAIRSSKDAHVSSPRRPRPLLPPHAATTQPVVRQSPHYARSPVDTAPYYNMQQPGMPGPPRPGARRPASYYAGQPSHPPPMSSSWQAQYSPQFQVGTFPPPRMQSPSTVMHAPTAPYGRPPPPEPQGYFDQTLSSERLKQRLAPRPTSAMGVPHSPSSYGPPDFEQMPPPPLSRRMSRSSRPEPERDRREMPPPPSIPRRPSSAMPSTPFRAPPQQAAQPSPQRQPKSMNPHRRSVGFADQYPSSRGFDDDELLLPDDGGLFHDMSPQPPHQTTRAARGKDRRGSVTYDYPSYDLVPAQSRHSRRSSQYESTVYGGGGASLRTESLEDAVMRYQDHVSGGKVPLTEKMLREQNKRGGVPSSRSTRSSESRDESEFKRSNTTGFTRSSSGGNPNEYHMLKVSGPATVRTLDGLEIQCNGGEVTFSTQSRSRPDHDREGTVYPAIEDSYPRYETRALPHRTRAPSQAGSQGRLAHAPYEPGLTSNNFL